MIILPDCNIPRAKFLWPVLKKEWMPSSQAQPKDQFGNENRTKFRIRAKSNDGKVIWCGWFDDRDDFDAFLLAIVLGTLKQQRALWDLPTPNWQPWMGELISYDFATVSFLSTNPGTNQTFSRPTDWSLTNQIEVVGAGGLGPGYISTGPSTGCGGGGGGAYSSIKALNISISTTYNVANNAPNPSTDCWFGATTFASANVAAKSGTSGVTPTSQGQSTAGGTGGAASSGIGTIKYSGGNGANASFSLKTGGGGGGAAGFNGAGNSAANNTGGSGDAGFGGAGGTTGVSSVADGSIGMEWSSIYGSGGGGAGGSSTAGTYGGGNGFGGLYGGGGGGDYAQGGNGTVARLPRPRSGAQGLIVVTWTPMNKIFNMPMLGM